MISLRIRGVVLNFEFSFFVVMALMFILCEPQLIAVIAGGCIIHEGGHIFAAAVSGVRIERVCFAAGGIRIFTEKRINSLSKDIFLLLSGPCFNLLAALAYYNSGEYLPYSVNLVLGLYNLLPFSCLDGGCVLGELLEYEGIFSDKPMKIIGVLSGVSVGILLGLWGIGRFEVYVVPAFLCVSEFCKEEVR